MMLSQRSGRRYTLLDIEATHPIPQIQISPRISGSAILVRYKGRPVHFWMEKWQRRDLLTTQELERIIWEKSGIELLKACIRDELRPRPVKVVHLPSITIAVCTRNRTELLARCLRSLKAMEPVVFGTSVSLKILVVDNAPSSEDTGTLVAACPGVRYIQEPRPGLDFARNRALEEARGDLLAYIDDDVAVDSGWLRGLMEAWIEYPDSAAFTGQVLPHELTTDAQIIFEERGGFRRGFDTIRYAQELDGHPAYPCSAGIFGTGANMVFQTNILKRLNGFDEALDTGPPLAAGGDHDIFYRLIRAGCSIVYHPDCLVFHGHRRDLKSLLRQYWSWGLGVMAVVDKWGRTDPSQRPKLRYLKRVWFRAHFGELISSLLGQTPIPFYMVAAEIAGAVIGLMGEYPRSVRRVQQIRRQFPSKLEAESFKLKATTNEEPGTRNQLLTRLISDRGRSFIST
jgi:glycosyltransferase involved in cell wall biosynthesis